MYCREIDACSLPNWIQDHRLRELTFKTKLIALDDTFLQWLRSGDFLINGEAFTARPQSVDSWDADSDEDRWKTTDLAEANEDDSNQLNSDDWTQLRNDVKCILEEYEGNVICKLNWSSPKDAVWISVNKSLKCENLDDIILLLKSSDNIQHDLSHPYDLCVDKSPLPVFYLVLRKWYDLQQALEFRCIVADKRLIGISQRNHSYFFPFLLDMKEKLKNLILSFFQDKIQNTFPLDSYTFDIYITKNNRVILVDFNPLAISTDLLMFTWDDVCNLRNQQLHPEDVELRVVLNEASVAASAQTGYPIDSIDVLTQEGMEQLIALQKEQDSNM